jgi:uncharacterized protein YqfA (UPF0365 family)
MKNIQADTSMRESISSSGEEDEEGDTEQGGG